MTVLDFPTPEKVDPVPEIMVDFQITGGMLAIAGRMPLAAAIEKLEEAADLLRAELKP